MQRNRSAHAAWGRCVFVGNLIRNLTLHLRVTIYMKKLRASDCLNTSPFFHVIRVQFCCLWNINSCLLTPNWVVMVGGKACNQLESSILITWYKWTNQKAGFSHSILMRHKNRALLVTSLMGKAVCKRRPFDTMTKYILLTCFVVFVLYLLILIIKGTEGKQ